MNLFSRSNLINLLITKSVAEALLVTATAVGFYLVTTNPNLRGWLDQADQRTVSGWVVDDKEADIRVEVQLYVDDKFVADRSAADFRPDVHQAKRLWRFQLRSHFSSWSFPMQPEQRASNNWVFASMTFSEP